MLVTTMFVTWRKLNDRYYAYLVASYWDKEKKGPRTSATYLGSSLAAAQKNLEKKLANSASLSSRAKIELLAKLGEKAPPEVINLPTKDRAKDSVVRQLGKLREKYATRQDIAFVLERAIERLS
ncbi:MAG TPA: hypothetical protein PKA10_13120 [Selenomonadales bacterium]|nr:hypothetical protein [Selenomonadales bacterium]